MSREYIFVYTGSSICLLDSVCVVLSRKLWILVGNKDVLRSDLKPANVPLLYPVD